MLHYARPLDILPSEGYVHMHSHHHVLHHYPVQQQQQPQLLNHYSIPPRPDTAESTTSSSQWDHESSSHLVSPLTTSFNDSPPFAYRHPSSAPVSASPLTPIDGPVEGHNHHQHHHQHPSFATLSGAPIAHGDSPNGGGGGVDDAAKTYSFVSLPGNAVKKRPRRRYDEIERLYSCNFPSCTKAYGTLNHLNAHIVMQRHGPKRTPTEFKELRKQWRKQKKDEAERAARMHASDVHAHVHAHAHAHAHAHGHHPHAHVQHSLSQHASMPNLHHAQQQQQQPAAMYPSYSMHHAQQLPQQHQHPLHEQHQHQHQHQQQIFRAQSIEQGYYLPSARRHSVPDPYATHTLHHSLSSASLSSAASHLSLSPPLEGIETPPMAGAWHSRAQAQGWDTAYDPAQQQPAYGIAAGAHQLYEHERGSPGAGAASYEGGGSPGAYVAGGSPDTYERASPGALGSLPPDSTLLAPLSVPGYIAPLAEDGRA